MTILGQCLAKALKVSDDTTFAFVSRILLSMIYQCSRDEDHHRAIADLQKAFDGEELLLSWGRNYLLMHVRFLDILAAETELPRVPATSCLTVGMA